jgi:hypothetical protein
MAGPVDGPPVVVLPERLDRRLRLGPFPSARDALKFLAYAAVGALVAALGSPLLGLVAIVVGFAAAVVRVDGQGIDRQALAFLRFHLGYARWVRGMSPGPTSNFARRGLAPGADGRFVAVLRAGGTPMAYLPPHEIARRFELFRELLRSGNGELTLFASLAPMRATPVTPGPLADGRPDRAARDGYAELVRLLCARRQVRRVDLVLASARVGSDGIADLEVRVGSLLDRLAALGVPAVRLTRRALLDVTRRTGGSTSREGR